MRKKHWECPRQRVKFQSQSRELIRWPSIGCVESCASRTFESTGLARCSVSGVRDDAQQGPGHRWKLHGEPLVVQSVGFARAWDDTLGQCLAVGVE